MQRKCTVPSCTFGLILAPAATGTFTYTRFHIPRAPTAPATAPAARARPGGLGVELSVEDLPVWEIWKKQRGRQKRIKSGMPYHSAQRRFSLVELHTYIYAAARPAPQPTEPPTDQHAHHRHCVLGRRCWCWKMEDDSAGAGERVPVQARPPKARQRDPRYNAVSKAYYPTSRKRDQTAPACCRSNAGRRYSQSTTYHSCSFAGPKKNDWSVLAQREANSGCW